MNREDIERIVARVIAESGAAEGGPLPLDVPVEVSGRHVHLTREAAEALFGSGAKLTPKRPLSQPGQFLSEERVSIITAKGRIDRVAVLGPERPAVQTELSVTDCRTLGIQAPIRMSGDLDGAADVYLIGPNGIYFAKGSAIIARAHVHLTPESAAKIGISDGECVSVRIGSERPVVFSEVYARVSASAADAMHIDSDEANACMLRCGTTARMARAKRGPKLSCPESGCRCVETPDCDLNLPGGASAPVSAVSAASSDHAASAEMPVPAVLSGETLITESLAKKLSAGRKGRFTVPRGVILTPSAKDVFLHAGIELVQG